METKAQHILHTHEVTRFLGLGNRPELLDDYEFSIRLDGELCPPSDSLVTIKEGIEYSFGNHSASARALLMYQSDLNGYTYSVEYNRFLSLEFDIKLDELIDFEGLSNTVEVSARVNFPMSYNHYDLDAETYKLTQAGYEAVLADFVDNVEPSRNNDSVNWIATIEINRRKKTTENEISDEDALLVAKHAYRSLSTDNEGHKFRQNVTLPNRKRGVMTIFNGLAGTGVPQFNMPTVKRLETRIALQEETHTWKSKGVIFAQLPNHEFEVELTVGSEIQGWGTLQSDGNYELEVRNDDNIQAVVKYFNKNNPSDNNLNKVSFEYKGDNYITRVEMVGE